MDASITAMVEISMMLHQGADILHIRAVSMDKNATKMIKTYYVTNKQNSMKRNPLRRMELDIIVEGYLLVRYHLSVK